MPSPCPLDGKRVWVAGHRGLVGSALRRRLAAESCQVLTADRRAVDLRRPADVAAWLNANGPEAAVIAAGTVGGIADNAARPADYLVDNLAIAASTIPAAHGAGIGRLLYLGSACIYPRLAPQPIREDALLSAPLEPTNDAYAVAKIAGLKLVEAFRQQHAADYGAVMPANLYGPGDRFDSPGAHVIPALIARLHAAKQADAGTVEVWGSGRALREFLYVDDLADAVAFLLRRAAANDIINVGSGQEIAIGDLARLIADIVGFRGRLRFRPDLPEGVPRRILDTTRLDALGWRAATDLATGLARTYEWYRDAQAFCAR